MKRREKIAKIVSRYWINHTDKPIKKAFKTCVKLFREGKYKEHEQYKDLKKFTYRDWDWYLQYLRLKPACEQDPRWKLPSRNKPRQSQEQQKEHLKNINAVLEALGPDATQMEREVATKKYCDEHNIKYKTYKSWDETKQLCFLTQVEIPNSKSIK